MSGILSCHLIFRSFLRQLDGSGSVFWHAVVKLSKFRSTTDLYTLSAKCCTSFGNPGIDLFINVPNSRQCASKVGELVYHLQSLTFTVMVGSL